MTIKQHGGIFGRNPTFNDLTVEGSVSVPADSISGDAINGGTATPTSLAVNTTTALDLVHFKESVNSATATQLLLQNEGSGNHAAGLGFQVSDSGELTSFAPKAGIVLERSAANGGGALKFYNDGSGDTTGFSSGDLRMEVLNTGNISITNGNLVMATSGTGIDFSATGDGPVTTDSELFNDYEEGVWSPDIKDSDDGSTIVTATNSGRYTKMGNFLYLEMGIFVNGLSSHTFVGYPYIDLPYNVGGNSEGAVFVVGYYNGTGTAKYGYVSASGDQIRLATSIDKAYNNTATGATFVGNIRLYGNLMARTG